MLYFLPESSKMEFDLKIPILDQRRNLNFSQNGFTPKRNSSVREELSSLPSIEPIPTNSTQSESQLQFNLPKLVHQNDKPISSRFISSQLYLPPISSVDSLSTTSLQSSVPPLPPLPSRYQSPTYRLSTSNKGQQEKEISIEHVEVEEGRLLSWDRFQQDTHRHSQQTTQLLSDWRPSQHDGKGEMNGEEMSSEDINEALLQS